MQDSKSFSPSSFALSSFLPPPPSINNFIQMPSTLLGTLEKHLKPHRTHILWPLEIYHLDREIRHGQETFK